MTIQLTRRSFIRGMAAATCSAAASAIPAAAAFHTGENKALATLIDIRKCTGCESCVEACREANQAKFPDPQLPFPKMVPERSKPEDWMDQKDNRSIDALQLGFHTAGRCDVRRSAIPIDIAPSLHALFKSTVRKTLPMGRSPPKGKWHCGDRFEFVPRGFQVQESVPLAYTAAPDRCRVVLRHPPQFCRKWSYVQV